MLMSTAAADVEGQARIGVPAGLAPIAPFDEWTDGAHFRHAEVE